MEMASRPELSRAEGTNCLYEGSYFGWKGTPVHELLGIFWATFHFSGNFFACEQLFTLRATILLVAAVLGFFHLLKVLLALKGELMFIL